MLSHYRHYVLVQYSQNACLIEFALRCGGSRSTLNVVRRYVPIAASAFAVELETMHGHLGSGPLIHRGASARGRVGSTLQTGFLSHLIERIPGHDLHQLDRRWASGLTPTDRYELCLLDRKSKRLTLSVRRGPRERWVGARNADAPSKVQQFRLPAACMCKRGLKSG